MEGDVDTAGDAEPVVVTLPLRLGVHVTDADIDPDVETDAL